MCLHVRMNFFCPQFGSSFQKYLHNEFTDLFSPAFFQGGNPSDKSQVFSIVKKPACGYWPGACIHNNMIGP